MYFTIILICLLFSLIALNFLFKNGYRLNDKPIRKIKIEYQKCKLERCDIQRNISTKLYEHNDTKYKDDYNKEAYKIITTYENVKYESVAYEISKNNLSFILRTTKYVYLEFYKNGLTTLKLISDEV